MGQESFFFYIPFLAWFHLCQLAKGMRKILEKSPHAQHHFDWEPYLRQLSMMASDTLTLSCHSISGRKHQAVDVWTFFHSTLLLWNSFPEDFAQVKTVSRFEKD